MGLTFEYASGRGGLRATTMPSGRTSAASRALAWGATFQRASRASSLACHRLRALRPSPRTLATARSCGWRPCRSSSARPAGTSSSPWRGARPTPRTRASSPRRRAASCRTSSSRPWSGSWKRRLTRARSSIGPARNICLKWGTRPAGATIRCVSLHRLRLAETQRHAGTGRLTPCQCRGRCWRVVTPTMGTPCLQSTLDRTFWTRWR
mmetsp:Transcript_181100/g.440694  ORF Transcript_181100/g.440694 Transcript_181100/m.440694 type:complete len:208 (-) Transcript_181100:306-929(-)